MTRRHRGGFVAGAVVVLLAVSGCASRSNDTELVGNNTCNVNGSDASITTEQNANARVIANVALGLGLGQRGAEVGIVTALTESTLIAVNYGDTASNGQMTSSRGLFQQKEEWGPLEDRLDPKKSSNMFYTGGAAGQSGLMDIEGWQQMPIPLAAQAVERSQFTDGSNYAKNLDMGLRIATSVLGSTVECASTAAGAIITDGVNVTVPNNEFVAPALRGKTIVAPTAKMAKGLAAGFGSLGLPYVWGGGGDGAGPNNGCSRGGGQLNSCGSEIGFDCSGLTAYVYVQGGYPSPGGNSGVQRANGQSVPMSQGVSGDLVGFDGHIGVLLVDATGARYILEASQVGTPVRVAALARTDYDSNLHRHWTSDVA